MIHFEGTPSGVTAVVLTTGEATTDESLESLRRQSLPADDIIVVRDVRPFHKALNAGAKRVTTPYFIQVDADMVLDRHCIAALRRAMKADVGIAVGLLRDAMVTQVVGVKLFRTACFEGSEFDDTISPDTDFVNHIERAGWRTVYVGRRLLSRGKLSTLGEHRPDYTPAYTYRKHLMEGERYRYRDSIAGFRGHLKSLEESTHPAALYASIGLARGFFRRTGIDALGRHLGDEEFERLDTFLALSTPLAGPSPLLLSSGAIRDRFAECFRFGHDALLCGDPGAFRDGLRTLRTPDGTPDRWILQLALCQGLLATNLDEEQIAFALCEEFTSESVPIDPSHADPRDRAQAAFEDFAAYAKAIGLSRFVLTTENAAEYVTKEVAGPYVASGAAVSIREDARGRRRIRVPFRFLGHAFSSEPERPSSLMWSLDLLKSGYAFVHVPGPFGAHRQFLPGLFLRTILERIGMRLGQPKGEREAATLVSLATFRTPTFSPISRRVLMVCDNLVRGGSERQMVAVAQGLLKRGFDVKFLALARLAGGVPSYEAELSDLGVVVDYASPDGPSRRHKMLSTLKGISPGEAVSIPAWLHWRMVEVAEAVTRFRPAVVHAWLDGPGLAGALAGSVMGVPRIVVQQGSLAVVRRGHSQSESMRRAYAAAALNPSVTIVNNSEAGARDNERWIGLPNGSIGVLLNGFVPGSSILAPPAAISQFRAAHNLPAGAVVVGTVMRFVPEKDPDLWLETAASIARSRREVRFLVCGFGPLEASITAKIAKLGLSDQVALAGPVTDVGLAYSAMNVVLLTSAIEGLPNVIIEAQAVGRLVVSTDAGGASEAISEGVTGTIVRERSADQLAAAVIAALDATDWLAAVATEGPKLVASRFGLDRMVAETIRYYGGTN